MLFKILHGDKARISTDITPYHEGYCYVTYDGDFYVDMNNERVKLNAKDCESIMGMSLDELKAELTTQDAVILHEAQAYTDTALANAKASGDLKGDKGEDGADGISATHSWNGTTLTVASASGTSSANLKGDKGDKGDQGIQGEKGADGAKGDKGDKGEKGDKGDTGEPGTPGYTPIRGTDYWTDADKAEMVSAVIAELPIYNGEVTTV